MERTGQVTETDCITQRWLHQYISHLTCSSYNMVLTFLHQEVGSSSPFLQLGQNFVNTTNSIRWKWLLGLGQKKHYMFHLGSLKQTCGERGTETPGLEGSNNLPAKWVSHLRGPCPSHPGDCIPSGYSTKTICDSKWELSSWVPLKLTKTMKKKWLLFNQHQIWGYFVM